MDQNNQRGAGCVQLCFVTLIVFSMLFISRYTVDYNSAFTGERNVKLAAFFNTLFANSREESNETAAPEPAGDVVDTCAGRYIYFHDLPTRFNDDIVADCYYSSLKWRDMCPSLINFGFGTRVDNPGKVLTEKGWYATDQFTLEVIFRSRIENYDCLTTNSSSASAIFVPFYAGFDIGRHLWGYNTTVRDALGVELVNWVRNQPEWTRTGLFGRDHFFVSGRVAWDLHRSDDEDTNWGNNLMQLPESANMTLLTIETSTWSNEFAVPYPTYFHPTSWKQVGRWQRRMGRRKRSYLFSFVGAPRADSAGSIRGELIKQCVASKRKCKFLNCLSAKCESPVEVMKVFQYSVFCLQPSGDSYTRKSTFDAILAGCIPVFFHPFTAYGQYRWHLPRNYSSYSVYIPEERVREGTVSVRKRLGGISKGEIAAMRRAVIELIPKVIYRDPNSKSREFKDAFDVAVDRVLERVSRTRRLVEEGKDPGMGLAEPDSWFSKVEWERLL